MQVPLDEQIHPSSARVGIYDRVAYPTSIMHALPSRAAHTNDIIPMGLVVSTFISGMLECGQSTLNRVSPVESVDWSRDPKWDLLLELVKCAGDLEKHQNRLG